jgi:hypothetical protein
MLTDALVTNPADIRATPKARTIGHAVGAGSLTVPGGASFVFVFEAIGTIGFRFP